MAEIIDAAAAVGVEDSPSDTSSADSGNTEQGAVEDIAGTPQATPESNVSTTSSEEAPEGVTDDAGDQDESSQDTSEIDNFDPSEVASKVDFDALSDDQKREVLRAFAEVNATPQFARDKILTSLSLFDSAIKEKQSFESKVKELEEQYNGKEALSPDAVQRYKELENEFLGVRSITAKPSDIHQFLQKQNPRVYDKFVADTAWQAFENPDGTPNMENFQKIVDKFAGEGKVDAKDVMQAVKALEEGDLDPAELYAFRTDDEQKAYETAKSEKEAATRDRLEAKTMRDKQEESYRTGITQTYASQIQKQLQTDIGGMLDKFKLGYAEGEPDGLKGFKRDLRSQLAGDVQQFMTANPHLKEVNKAMQYLQDPQGMAHTDAEREIREYLDSDAYKSTLNAGLSALREHVEKRIAQSAKQYAWTAKGYEVMEKERIAKAKATPGKKGQTVDTQEDFDTTGMTPNQINDENMRRLSRQANAWSEDVRRANGLG